ncbi:MAG: oligosaccharyl transferase, archaeosortase A system-associated [Methanosarcinales archaeon]|nr:oligosaccharyl transferase, archaeosortase A system-associated [Methanosarcinales archaeon]
MHDDNLSLKGNTKLYFVLIFLVAICIRLLSFPKVFVDNAVHPIGFDSYYHLRRIQFTTTNFPENIKFDTYVNFPYGFEIGWPPLYDQAVSFLAFIIGFGSPDTLTVELTAAFFPVLLGILTFIPLYYIVSKIFNKDVALLSVCVLAILPGHIRQSLFGFSDHHVAEILLSTAAYTFFVAALKIPVGNQILLADVKNIRKIPFGFSFTKPLLYAICAGVLLAVSLLTWIGSPIFIGLIAIYVLIQSISDVKENKSSEHTTIMSSVTLFATLILILPFVLIEVRPGLEMSPMFLSWFHVLFITFTIISVFTIGFISSFVKTKTIVWWYYPLLIFIPAIIGIFLIKIISPSLYWAIISGLKYLIGSGEILRTVAEAQPLFFDSGNVFTLSPVWYYFTFSFFIAIWAFVICIKNVAKEHYPPETVFFLVWTIVIFSLTLSQRRFTYLLSINIAILTGYFIMMNLEKLKLGKHLKVSSGKKKSKKSKQVIKIDSWKRLRIIMILVIIILPNLYVSISAATNPVIPHSDWEESLNWLKENTPQTSYYANASETPEYGVLSWWDYGNWIIYIANRPVVTNNFQPGLDDVSKFFIESEESEAMAILDARSVRYVITDDELILNKFRSIVSIAGKNPDDYYESKEMENNNLVTTIRFENERFKRTILWALHINDGSNLGCIRLIHESNTTRTKNPPVKYVKIFEYVDGANIFGLAQPNEIVMVQTNITTNRGRTFTYYNEAIANETGWYRINVPYSNYGTPYEGWKIESYNIHGSESNASKEIVISETEIINGKKIRVNLF